MSYLEVAGSKDKRICLAVDLTADLRQCGDDTIRLARPIDRVAGQDMMINIIAKLSWEAQQRGLGCVEGFTVQRQRLIPE